MTVTDPMPDPSDLTGRASARRVGVLGLGRVGLAYAMAIARHSECELAGFAEPRTELRRFAKGAGFTAPSAPTLERLLAKSALDAVVVCAPPQERVALIEAAIAAKLAVLVDGMPSPDAEGASRLEPLFAAAAAPVMCGAGVLFHPLFQRASRLLASGALGAQRQVRASVFVSRVFGPAAAAAGGDVLDFAVSDLLMLIDLLFGPARSVAAGVHQLYAERIDEVHATLQLVNGPAAGVDGSWSVPGYPRAAQVIEAQCEKGTLLVSDDALEVELASPADGLAAGLTRRVGADEPDPTMFEAGDASRMLVAFVRALGSGRDEALSADRALRVVRTLGAIRRSVEAGGAAQELAT